MQEQVIMSNETPTFLFLNFTDLHVFVLKHDNCIFGEGANIQCIVHVGLDRQLSL